MAKDEDDALVQVMNHGASIHRAGFLSDTLVYALSHDEVFSLYHLSTSGDDIEPEKSVQFGDLRPAADCEYVLDILQTQAGIYIAVGSHRYFHQAQSIRTYCSFTRSPSRHALKMIPLHSSPIWELQTQEAVQLMGAHGEEIVRSIYIDQKVKIPTLD